MGSVQGTLKVGDSSIVDTQLYDSPALPPHHIVQLEFLFPQPQGRINHSQAILEMGLVVQNIRKIPALNYAKPRTSQKHKHMYNYTMYIINICTIYTYYSFKNWKMYIVLYFGKKLNIYNSKPVISLSQQ